MTDKFRPTISQFNKLASDMGLTGDDFIKLAGLDNLEPESKVTAEQRATLHQLIDIGSFYRPSADASWLDSIEHTDLSSIFKGRTPRDIITSSSEEREKYIAFLEHCGSGPLFH